MRRRKLVVLAEQAVAGCKCWAQCTSCGAWLEAGELVVCDGCWSRELEKRVALGDTRWGVDLESARLRIAARARGSGAGR